MTKCVVRTILVAWFGTALPVAAIAQVLIPPTNPPATVIQAIGATEVEVHYSRPGMKNRSIFGGLVPYGQIWRTGADNATTIAFSTPVTLNGVAVPAGTYELFTIPGASEWTVIVQQRQNQWGSYSYDPVHDVARVRAVPAETAAPVETFTIGFSELTKNSAVLNLAWERTRVPVAIGVDVVAQVVPKIRAAMQSEGRKPYFLAAMFYFENDLDLDQAAAWMAAALAGQPDHIGMLYRQALILEKKGDIAGALAAAERSLAGAETSPRELREEYIRLNTPLIARLRKKGK